MCSAADRLQKARVNTIIIKLIIIMIVTIIGKLVLSMFSNRTVGNFG